MNKRRFLCTICIAFGIFLVAACEIIPTPDSGEKGVLQFDPQNLPNASLNQEYAVTITIKGGSTPVGDVFLEEGNLPEGLVIEKIKGEGKGIIRGMPIAAGTYQFTIGAWCFGTNRAGDQGSKEYSIVVSP